MPDNLKVLEHTAQQIDEAVSRAISGGDIDITLANKAPAGFGLGGYPKSIDSWDDALVNGWYRAPAPSGVGSGSIWGRVDCLTNTYLVQTVYTDSYKSSARRFRIGNVFGEWEWVNPPMQLGVEYRTTERYQEKPVYAKTINTGNLPNASTKIISNYAENVKYVVNFDGYSYYFGQSLRNSDFARMYVLNTYIKVQTFTNLSAGDAAVWVKYTKTTD